MRQLDGMIGLEIHAYPVTKEKLFCKCKAKRGKGLEPNKYICEICTGQPGAKPMLPNKEAVKKAILVGRMLNCKISGIWKWQRKHYDWPDMPKGYQNTISGGLSKGVGVSGEFHKIRIRSMHLEEDPASWDPETGEVDYNRSGLPLVEIITEPDFTNSEQVVAWLRRLIANLGYLKIIDKDAGIKVDVNVNIPGKTDRVEVKNINSVENIGKAIEYELERQGREGGKIEETRRFDVKKNSTELMRIKEGQEDYRFITDPDLKDAKITVKFVLDVEKNLPETPEEKLEKLVKKYKLGEYDAEVLAKNIDIVEFFEEVTEKGKDLNVKEITRWITVELLRHLNYNKKNLDELNIKPEHFVSLLRLIRKGNITEQQGKKILDKFIPESFDPAKEIKGKSRIEDAGELEGIIEKVIKINDKAVEDYKRGEKKSFNFLMGQVMRETKGRADNKVAGEILREMLKR